MKDAILFDITDIILYLLAMHENEFLNAWWKYMVMFLHCDVSTVPNENIMQAFKLKIFLILTINTRLR